MSYPSIQFEAAQLRKQHYQQRSQRLEVGLARVELSDSRRLAVLDWQEWVLTMLPQLHIPDAPCTARELLTNFKQGQRLIKQACLWLTPPRRRHLQSMMFNWAEDKLAEEESIRHMASLMLNELS